MSESDEVNSELPLDGVGARLRRAREAASLNLADIAARTRIAERHLQAIEAGDFSRLASRAYAVGFARNYAREVGLDEDEIARAVRLEFEGQEHLTERYKPAAFEPGDPARVPAARLAWIAALSALGVVIAGYTVWRSFYAPAMPLPDLVADAVASPDSGQPAGATVQPAPPAQGPVVFTALEQGIWVKFYDAAGQQLLQKELALGESFTVPAGADNPMIRTARPEALQVTIGGQIVPRLAERQMTIGDVPVSAAALLARGQAPAPGATAGLATQAASTPAPVARREPPRPSPAPARSAAPSPPAPAPTAVAPPAEPPPAAASQSSTVSQ